MVGKLKALGKNTLIRGSFFIFLGTFIGNIANYVYQLLMGRMLEPSTYATLFSIISLGYFFSLPNTVIQQSVTKIVSEIKARGEEECLRALFRQLNRVLALGSILALLILVLIGPRLISFLHLELTSPVMYLFYAQLIVGVFMIVPPAIFQGLLKFEYVPIFGVLPAILKLILAVGFILLGWGLAGVLGAQLMAVGAGLGVALVLLYRVVFSSREKVGSESGKGRTSLIPAGAGQAGQGPTSREDLVSCARRYLKQIGKFSLPVLLVNLGLVAFHNSDVLLVKHFFPAIEAARYASVILLGRIIFFSTSAVGMALFPISSLHHANGEGLEKAHQAFRTALLLVLISSLGALAAYTLFPELIVMILFGKKYLSAVPLMPRIAMFMGIYSMINLLVQFLLAVRETKVFIPLLAGASVQAVGIVFYHNSLEQIITISIGSAIVVLISLVAWFFRVPRV